MSQSVLKNKVCRLCLSLSNCCIHLNSKWSEAMKLRKIINYLLPFQIDEHDAHSKFICWSCCMHIQLLNTFVEKCVQRNETLRGVAGSSHSQPSQSSCTSASGSVGGSSRGVAVQRPDWLSLSFDSDSTVSGPVVPTETTALSAQPAKKKLEHTVTKAKNNKTKKSSDHKENRCKTVRRTAGDGSSPDLLAWKVSRQDVSPCRHNLRNNTATQHVTVPSSADTKRSSRRTAKTRRDDSWQNRSREPLFVFSRNAPLSIDEDAHIGKTGSDFNFSLNTEDTPPPKKDSKAAAGGQKWGSDDLLRSSRGPDSFDADLKSLLDCSDLPEPFISTGADEPTHGKQTASSDNVFRGKNFLGIQSQYPHDDLSAQFARRHLSFVSEHRYLN